MAETESTGGKAHWEAVYAARDEDALTWFEAEAHLSLALIAKYARLNDPILDVGGGTSRLVDGLLGAGYSDVSVLDLAQSALDTSRARLGDAAGKVAWHCADITRWHPADTYRLWHDRAVFHFLTDHDARAGYVRALLSALRPGGTAILATFALDGPEMCSGLPVCRYSPQTLADTLDALAPGMFARLEDCAHTHITPLGRKQKFQFSVFARA